MLSQRYRGIHDVDEAEASPQGQAQDIQPVSASPLDAATRQSARFCGCTAFQRKVIIAVLIAYVVLMLIVALLSIFVTRGAAPPRSKLPGSGSTYLQGPGVTVSRIGFGSCTTKGVHDAEEQLIWTQGVIPAQPDAWIWLGDFAYLDYPSVNCDLLPDDPDCHCEDEAVYLKTPPYCMAGNQEHALSKFQTMLANPQYREFLEYMCPDSMTKGYYPPPGTDGDVCPRPVLGTWDDHDFGWNDGDSRMPEKWVFKQFYLDAMGEHPSSPRRNQHRGMWAKYTLNSGQAGKEVDVFLLDERWHRDPKPCHIRREECTAVINAGNASSGNDLSWCLDFLQGGPDHTGSCCKNDEQIQLGWCKLASSASSPLFEEACDVTSDKFAQRSLVLDPATGDLRPPTGGEATDIGQQSPLCDVLGQEQRKWLRTELLASRAPLKLVVSGSVLLGNPGLHNDSCALTPCACSGDDFDCYNTAQKHLLHLVSITPGCAVILTGDYHWGDIKVMRPGAQLYSEYYGSGANSVPIYQAMSSGMTDSVALPWPCTGYHRDPTGLRDHPECDFVTGPNFGIVEVEWSKRGVGKVDLQVRDWRNNVRLQSTVTSDMCNPL